jgi:hypothetical protein
LMNLVVQVLTNSFLKLFGGLNKGRPNAEDLKHAEEFAQNLKHNTSGTDMPNNGTERER